MAQSIIIHALVEKRAELAGSVSDLERRIHQARADLAHIDATLCLFDPTIRPASIKPKAAPPTKSPHFDMGEIARRCREGLRLAGPEGVTAIDVAATALRDKGISPTDTKLVDDFQRRMSWTLTRLGQEGVARKEGQGIGARWTLPQGG